MCIQANKLHMAYITAVINEKASHREFPCVAEGINLHLGSHLQSTSRQQSKVLFVFLSSHKCHQ